MPGQSRLVAVVDVGFMARNALAHAHRRGLQTGIATNGFLLDVATADWMQAVHVCSVQVTLDGPEKTHNGIRGRAESFARAMHAIDLLIAHHVPLVSVATTVAVDPDVQGHGIGTALMTFALNWMQHAGMAVAMVETGADDGHAPARRLYEQLGFGLLPVERYLKRL